MLFLLMYSLRLITILIYGVLIIPIFNEEKESEGKKYVSLNILVYFKTYPSYAGYVFKSQELFIWGTSLRSAPSS